MYCVYHYCIFSLCCVRYYENTHMCSISSLPVVFGSIHRWSVEARRNSTKTCDFSKFPVCLVTTVILNITQKNENIQKSYISWLKCGPFCIWLQNNIRIYINEGTLQDHQMRYVFSWPRLYPQWKRYHKCSESVTRLTLYTT